jgi:hypothetical protein
MGYRMLTVIMAGGEFRVEKAMSDTDSVQITRLCDRSGDALRADPGRIRLAV